jgi:hypothetical protein
MADLSSRPRQSLNGDWQIVFDPSGTGLAEGWAAGQWPAAQAELTQVPGPWEVTHPAARGVGFYRRTLVVPGDWAGRVIGLHFGGAAYRAEAWIDGRFAGTHEGAYTPFNFEVTALVRPGAEHELIVRVAGLARERPVDGQVLVQAPASKQSWYYEYSGLWDEVYLEARPLVSIDSLRVEPDLRRENAWVEVAVANHTDAIQPVRLHLRVMRPDGGVAAEQGDTFVALPGLTRYGYRLSLPRPWPWHPDTPHLYQLAAELAPETGLPDRAATRFGMRDFSVQNGQFILNGSPIFLRGVLLQPNYPVRLIAPPDREMMVRELRLVKEAGFNLLRAHIRPAPPGYLDLADELGLLVYAENSLAWIRDSPRMLDHGRREVTALIERDFNHPCVVVWGIFNENRFAAAKVVEPLLRLARSLDPTRVIVDNSGGTMAVDQDFGWIDRASVIPNRATTRERSIDVHLYLGATLPGSIYAWLRGLGDGAASATVAEQDFGAEALMAEFDRELRGYSGQIFVSELGCGGMADLDETVAGFGERTQLRDAQELVAFRDSLHAGFAARQLDHLFGDVHHLALAAQAQHAAGNANQIEAVMANPRISGYCITQLNDVGWEFHAGLLDLWRKPKPAYYASQRLNRPQVVILHAQQTVVALSGAIGLSVTQVNRDPLPAGARIELSLTDPAGRAVALESRLAVTTAGIHELGVIDASVGELPGNYQVRARLLVGPDVAAETQQTVLALATAAWAGSMPRMAWVGDCPSWLSGLAGAPNVSEPSATDASVLIAPRPGSLLESDWTSLLGRTRAGATAVLGPLHKRDVLAIRWLGAHGLTVKLNLAIGNWMGCYHWAPNNELFADLPAGGLAGPAYVEVLPWYALDELGGEVLAGSFNNTQTRLEPPRMRWYSDVEIVPHGSGRIILCQYRLFDLAAPQPLAGRLVCNLLRVAAGGRAPQP